jgi:prepilin-type N-terminal cleavage/methylation domain-containing protein
MRRLKKQSAFTLLEILIVVAIIGVILSIALPNFLKTRANAQKHVCIENLTQIEAAKQTFGLERGKKEGDPVFDSDLFGPTLYVRKKPECPSGGDYDLKSIGINAECSNGPTLDHVLQ